MILGAGQLAVAMGRKVGHCGMAFAEISLTCPATEICNAQFRDWSGPDKTKAFPQIVQKYRNCHAGRGSLPGGAARKKQVCLEA